MTKAADKAYASIRAMILSGELTPGAPLAEEALAEKCDVSRTPVRDALRRLEAEMLVTRTGSQRSFVAEWSLDDIAESFELRAMLESLAARKAAAQISNEQLAEIKACNRKVGAIVAKEKVDIPAFLECNRGLHAIIMEAAASPRLSMLLATLVEQPVVFRTALQYGRSSLQQSHNEHMELAAAFERGDGDWAASIMAAHIRRAFHAYADAHTADIKNHAA